MCTGMQPSATSFSKTVNERQSTFLPGQKDNRLSNA